MKQLTLHGDVGEGRRLSGLNNLVGHAAEADTYYLFTDTFWRPGAINAGVTFQAGESNVTISYTLAPKQQVLDAPSSVPWTSGNTINAGDMRNDLPIAFTAVKLVFAGAGSVYIGIY
jgi:hypothetical protein